MTPSELKDAIFEEVNERDFDNWHGISKSNLDEFLVEPQIIELSTWGKQVNNYWLVLDERKDDFEDGYRIIYDEREKMFGLATKTTVENKKTGYLVGLYGSFADALNAM